MAKAVLMSIQPKWCELIANRKKRVEVRKTRPKLETPFKVYMYESKGTKKFFSQPSPIPYYEGKCKVIGEFVCDEIKKGTLTVSDLYDSIDISCSETCLRVSDIKAYLGMKYVEMKGNYTFYGWHISNLVIYDKPKGLSEFRGNPCNAVLDIHESCTNCGKCGIKRPPQSWMYVEELRE